MLITVSSVRGSPGVTSWALLLAAAWPRDAMAERIVLEADCSGGVLGARYQLGVEPGAVSLVSACRRGNSEFSPGDHARLLDEGLWVVPGPEVAEQAVPVWRSGVADVAETLSQDQRLWVVDLGRSEPESPVRPLAATAAVNVVLTGGAVEDIVQVPARVAELERCAPTQVILVGRSHVAQDELRAFFGGRLRWLVPAPNDLPRLAMRAVQGGRARRSALWRAAVAVAVDLADLVSDQTSTSAPAQTPAPTPSPTSPPTPLPTTVAASVDPPIPPSDRRLDRLPDIGGRRGADHQVDHDAPLVSPAVQAAVANSYLLGEEDGGD